MAEQKTILEREYIIPLRRGFLGKPYYKRSRKAVMIIKEFIAKHMKVPGRDLDNVKIDVYLNNEIWFRGKQSPPSKIKVRAIKEGDVVKVTLAEMPEAVKFAKSKVERRHLPAEKAKEKVAEPKSADTKEEKAEHAEKQAEVEKEKATEIEHIKEAKQDAKAQKHTTPVKETPFHRTSMDRH